jgi:hypothetical protein
VNSCGRSRRPGEANQNIRGSDPPKVLTRTQAARGALAKCESVDECARWAKKAEALASYAKQAQDDTLRRMCDRIQARAIRRAGELLRAITPAKNQHVAEARARGGAPPSRTQAARDAGLSDDQRKTALRVATIPGQELEALLPTT